MNKTKGLSVDAGWSLFIFYCRMHLSQEKYKQVRSVYQHEWLPEGEIYFSVYMQHDMVLMNETRGPNRSLYMYLEVERCVTGRFWVYRVFIEWRWPGWGSAYVHIFDLTLGKWQWSIISATHTKPIQVQCKITGDHSLSSLDLYVFSH